MSEKAKTPRTLKQKLLRAGGAIGLVGVIGGAIALGEHNQSEELAQNNAPVATSSSKVPHPNLETSTNTPTPTTTTAETRQLPEQESVSPERTSYNIATMGQNIKIMFDQAPADQKSSEVGPNGATVYTTTTTAANGAKYTMKDTETGHYQDSSAGVTGVSVNATGDNPYTFTFNKIGENGWDLTCKDPAHNVHIDDKGITLTSGKTIADPEQAQVELSKASNIALGAVGDIYAGNIGTANGNPVQALCAPLEG